MNAAGTPLPTAPTLSPRDVAERLDIAYGTARNLFLSGRLKSVCIGTGPKYRHMRTSEAWLAEFMGSGGAPEGATRDA